MSFDFPLTHDQVAKQWQTVSIAAFQRVGKNPASHGVQVVEQERIDNPRWLTIEESLKGHDVMSRKPSIRADNCPAFFGLFSGTGEGNFPRLF